MSLTRFVPSLLLAASLVLAGCSDKRPDTVRDYLKDNPPEGLEVVEIPEKITLSSTADGGSESVVTVKYRLAAPTIEVRDISSLPRGVEVAKRLSDVRGWAISSLPADNPTRKTITSISAALREDFPIKHVVAPKGTEVESAVTVTLAKTKEGWKVEPAPINVAYPGKLDRVPAIPFEDSPEVAAKLDELEATTKGLEDAQQKYLTERREASARSLAKLRSILKTGQAFEGTLPNGMPVRLVISQGADAGQTIVVVAIVEGPEHSTARYTGTIVQQPSGEAVWRAAQATSYAGPTGQLLTDVRLRPILTLATKGDYLAADLQAGTRPKQTFSVAPAEVVDLLPEESPQDAGL